jgi:hypothetical protein
MIMSMRCISQVVMWLFSLMNTRKSQLQEFLHPYHTLRKFSRCLTSRSFRQVLREWGFRRKKSSTFATGCGPILSQWVVLTNMRVVSSFIFTASCALAGDCTAVNQTELENYRLIFHFSANSWGVNSNFNQSVPCPRPSCSLHCRKWPMLLVTSQLCRQVTRVIKHRVLN